MTLRIRLARFEKNLVKTEDLPNDRMLFILNNDESIKFLISNPDKPSYELKESMIGSKVLLPFTQDSLMEHLGLADECIMATIFFMGLYSKGKFDEPAFILKLYYDCFSEDVGPEEKVRVTIHNIRHNRPVTL